MNRFVGYFLLTCIFVSAIMLVYTTIKHYTVQEIVDAVDMQRDPETGCEYLVTKQGSITPRMQANGTQICRKVETF